MKQITTSIASDAYGTAQLTFGQLYLAILIVALAFAYLYKKNRDWKRLGI